MYSIVGANIEAVNSEKETALMYAAKAGHIHVCKVLLDAGAQNASSTGGTTAIDMAKNNGFKAIVDLLKERFSVS